MLIKTDVFSKVYIYNLIFVTLISSSLARLGLSIQGADYVIFYLSIGFLIFYNFKRNLFKIGSIDILFVILFIFVCLNIVVSYYVKSPLWAIIGLILILMIPISNLIFKDIIFTEKNLLRLFKITSRISLILIIAIYVEFLINTRGLTSLRGISSLFKDGGLAATFININVIINLSLYKLTKERFYKYMIYLSVLTILLLLYVKSIIILFVILFSYYFFFGRGDKLVKVISIVFLVLLSVASISWFNDLSSKLDRYYFLYFASGASKETPRNALYYASVEIANDMFPFGAGVSTFGSYPVNTTYNNIYYDYKLNHLHGLGEPTKGRENFLLDTYWSSILGELGYVGILMFLCFFFYPLSRLIKIKKIRPENKIYAFVVACIVLDVAIESITLSIASQVNIILIVSGLCNFIVSYLKHDSILYKNMVYKKLSINPL